MKTKFDLTNKDELLSVITGSAFGMGATIAAVAAVAPIAPLAAPILIAGKYVAEKIFSNGTLKAQQEAAEKLIEKGKENGVDEMEITVDNTRAFKLNVPGNDVKIVTMLGADEKMHIKVKYK